jgi:hypothetical protein
MPQVVALGRGVGEVVVAVGGTAVAVGDAPEAIDGMLVGVGDGSTATSSGVRAPWLPRVVGARVGIR